LRDIFSRFEKEKEIYFVTKHSKIDKRGKFSLILSPEFYWIKKESLPVKRVYEAKKLAPSVFDGFLPDGDYSYLVYKDGEEFVLIAYDKEKILEDLLEVVEDLDDVEEIRFAQTEFEKRDECVNVDDKSSLVWIEDIAVFIPRICAEGGISIEDLLKDVKLSKYKIRVSQKDLLDTKTLILYAIPFVILSASFLIEYAVYKKAIKEMESKKESIIVKYHLPRTSIQLNSIKTSLLSTYKKQKKIRDFIDFISELRIEKNEFLKSISVTDKEASLSIKLSSSSRKEKIKRYISKKYKIMKESMQGDILNLEIRV